MDTRTPISEIIRARTSRRTFLTGQLPEETLLGIEQKISENRTAPLGTNIRFTLISLDAAADQKLRLGTYGFIQGARFYIAGQIAPSREGFLDYGFVLEKLILELTGMNLGTCWLGGTFDRAEFSKAIGLEEGNVIPAITPVGIASSTRGIGERLIRLGAGSKNRLPRERLFFGSPAGDPLILPEGDPVQEILEGVRIGPSASNNQPWRIVAEGNRFRFHLSRKPGYQKAFSRVDIQMLDIGIAMAHFDLVAREYGRIPEWKIEEAAAPFNGSEYVISVFLRG